MKRDGRHRAWAAQPSAPLALGRSAIWSEPEIAALRDRAWALGYHGLAVAIAVAHDTQLAPVNVRLLTLAMRARTTRASTSTPPSPRPAEGAGHHLKGHRVANRTVLGEPGLRDAGGSALHPQSQRARLFERYPR